MKTTEAMRLATVAIRKTGLRPTPVGQPAEGQLGRHGHGGVDGEEGSDLSDAQAPSLQGESRHGHDHPHGEAVEELMPLEEVHVPAREGPAASRKGYGRRAARP